METSKPDEPDEINHAATRARERYEAGQRRKKERAFMLKTIRTNPHHANARGLFLNIPDDDNARITGKWVIPVSYGKDSNKQPITMKFVGFTLLNDYDLGVFLTLLCYALAGQKYVTFNNHTAEGDFIRKQLNLGFDAPDMPTTYVVKASMRELTKHLVNSDSLKDRQKFADSLVRLQSVVVIVEDGSGWQSSNLIGGASGSHKGQINIILNPLVSEALAAEAHYIQLDYDKFVSLPSGTARLLYHYLCGKCWKIDQSYTLLLDDLVGHIFPREQELLERAPTPALKTAWRNKRRSIKLALTQIAELAGWTITDNENTKKPSFTLIRSKKPGYDNTISRVPQHDLQGTTTRSPGCGDTLPE